MPKRGGRLARPCKKHLNDKQRFRLRMRRCTKVNQGYFAVEWYCMDCMLERSRRQKRRKKLERGAKLMNPDDMWNKLPVDYFSNRRVM